MKLPRLMPVLAITALALSACGGQLDSSPSQPAPATTTAVVQQSSTPETTGSTTASTQTTTQAAEPSQQETNTTTAAEQPTQTNAAAAPTMQAKSDEKCGTQTVEQAVNDNIHKVPEYFPGDDTSDINNHPGSSWISETSLSDFDPCADLSWVVLHTNGHSLAIPYQIMLFHKGEYIGTPSEVSFAMNPVIRRLSGDKIEVGYRWALDGESNAEAQVRATSTFTYNPSTGGVDHAGQWPKSEIIRADGTLPIDDVLDRGVARRAGGDVPGDAYEAKAFQTPSGNIICALAGSKPMCWELSNKQTIELSTYNESPQIVDGLHDIGNGELPVANYGSTVYSPGSSACAIEENGVTCWNNTTGHGAFISKQDTFTF